MENIIYKVTAIDLRDYSFTHKNLISLKGDFLEYQFKEKFNAVISLSVIEHFGFSKRYGGEDEPENNYDILAFEKISQILTTDGHAIISVPYARAHVPGVWYRVYTRDDIEDKLGQYFTIEEKKYYFRRDNEWTEARVEDDPELPYDGVALFLLGKTP